MTISPTFDLKKEGFQVFFAPEFKSKNVLFLIESLEKKQFEKKHKGPF